MYVFRARESSRQFNVRKTNQVTSESLALVSILLSFNDAKNFAE